MAQMELIHWECKGKIEKEFIQHRVRCDGTLVDEVTYSCSVCKSVFVYNDDGLSYWFKVNSPTLEPIPEESPVNISELAREISCEGRVM